MIKFTGVIMYTHQLACTLWITMGIKHQYTR